MGARAGADPFFHGPIRRAQECEMSMGVDEPAFQNGKPVIKRVKANQRE